MNKPAIAAALVLVLTGVPAFAQTTATVVSTGDINKAYVYQGLEQIEVFQTSL